MSITHKEILNDAIRSIDEHTRNLFMFKDPMDVLITNFLKDLYVKSNDNWKKLIKKLAMIDINVNVISKEHSRDLYDRLYEKNEILKSHGIVGGVFGELVLIEFEDTHATIYAYSKDILEKVLFILKDID